MAEENRAGESRARESRAGDSSAETSQNPTPAAEPPAAELAPPLQMEPEPVPTPEPTPEPEPSGLPEPPQPEPPQPEPPQTETAPSPGLDPSIAATITVPPLEGADAADGEGGEWALLSGKLQDWLASGELQRLWQQARTPLTALLAVVAVALVLRLYASLLGALNGLPLVPGLLELVGVIWLLRQGLPKLLRSSERRELVAGLKQRWESFLGGD